MSTARLDRTCSRKANITWATLRRSSVTDAVKGLEARLGVRLLQRTTRQVSPTLDEEAYYQRCVSLIADLEDAEGAFVDAKPLGTRSRRRAWRSGVVFPAGQPHALPRYVPGHSPAFRRSASAVGDDPRRVRPRPQGLRTRRQPVDQTAACDARPGHLRQPRLSRAVRHAEDAPDEPDGHKMVGYLAPDTTEIIPLAFRAGGDIRRFTLPTMMTVTGPRRMWPPPV